MRTSTFAYLLGLTDTLPNPSPNPPVIRYFDVKHTEVELPYPLDSNGRPKEPGKIINSLYRDVFLDWYCACGQEINIFIAPLSSHNPSHRGKHLLQCRRAPGHRCGYVVCLDDLYLEALIHHGFSPNRSSSPAPSFSSPLSTPPQKSTSTVKKEKASTKEKFANGEKVMAGSKRKRGQSSKEVIERTDSEEGPSTLRISKKARRRGESPVWWCSECEQPVTNSDKHLSSHDHTLVQL